MIKHFKATEEIYEAIRLEIDNQQGFPNPYAHTCIPPITSIIPSYDGFYHIYTDIDYVIETFTKNICAIEVIQEEIQTYIESNLYVK